MEATNDRKRYWMTTPVHPEKVVDFFLMLHHYWFDESLGANAFTGMRDLATAYLRLKDNALYLLVQHAAPSVGKNSRKLSMKSRLCLPALNRCAKPM